MAQVRRSRGPPPIDRGWAWMISLGFFIYVFFMVGLAKSFGLILVALIKKFQVSTATAAMPISVTLFIYAFGAPCAILIAERFTIRKVVIVGAIIGFFGMAISSLLVNMTYFILTFGLFYGIGNSCFYGNGMILIGSYFRDRRSLANGLALSGASVGQFALPPLIEFLLENYGLNGTLLLIGAFYLHGAISGSLFRPIQEYDSLVPPEATKYTAPEEEKPMITDSKPNSGENGSLSASKTDQNGQNDSALLLYKDSEKALDGYHVDGNVDKEDELMTQKRQVFGSQGSVFMVSQSMLDLAGDEALPDKPQAKTESKNFLAKVIDFRMLRNRVTLFYTLMSFFCFFGYFNYIMFLPSVIIEKGFVKYDKAFLISICGIGDLIARISIGFFADLNIIPRYKIKALACLFCSVNIFMFVFADTYIWLGVHCFLYGFLGGGYVCMVAVVLVDFVGLKDMGRNLAVVLFIQGIGSSAGNPFLGFLKDQTGNFTMVSIVCALSLFLGGVLLFMYPVFQRLEQKRVEKLEKEGRNT